jgi:A/G-specific adenine glycosylase
VNIAALLTWYRASRRDLPWRRTRDPYAIWVSEVMLQQTRVATVIPYWQAWMAKFPSVAALAEAPLDDVLAAWAGLGYYSRARNLHAGAAALAGRAFPRRAAELREVRGIGPYTAGAIASIAFGERAPLVDGNVARVLARVYAIDDDIKSTVGKAATWRRAGEVMAALPDGEDPGELNQAVMELGATLCTPTQPRCERCPVAAACIAHRARRVDELPVMPARKRAAELPLLAREALWLERAGAVVLARRRPDGLFGGLWELPQGTRATDIAAAIGARDVERTPVAIHDQVLTHRRLRVSVFRAAPPPRLVDAAVPEYDRFASVPLDGAARRGIAAATAALFARYRDDPWTSTPKRSRSSPRATPRSSKASTSSASTPRTPTSRRRRRAPPKASTS